MELYPKLKIYCIYIYIYRNCLYKQPMHGMHNTAQEHSPTHAHRSWLKMLIKILEA